MKLVEHIIKSSLFLFALLLTGSCNLIEPTNYCTEKRIIESENSVEESEALASAINFITSFAKEGTSTKSEEDYVLHNVEYLYSESVSTKIEHELPICYLFNFKDNKGYVLISAVKRTKDLVFLVSEKGNLSFDNIAGSQYELILDLVNEYQKRAISKAGNQTKAGSYLIVETIISTVTKGPLLDTQWNQGYPYNIVGAGLLGCTTIAMGQTLAYYEKPSVITIEGNNHNVDWDIIINQTYPIENPSFTWQWEVSSFLYQLRTLIGVNSYGGANALQLCNAYTALGANFSFHNNYSNNHILYSINTDKPVNIFGWTGPGTNDDGHCWIIDGYKYLTVDVATYDEDGNPVENTIPNNDYNYTSYRRYWHCNFGWGGTYDGYSSMCYMDNYIDGSHFIYIFSSIFDTPPASYNYDIFIIYNISL